MKSVLFLDVDGVLNSAAFFAAASKRQYHRRRSAGKAKAEADGRWEAMIDPAAVKVLNLAIRATDPDVVISSTWRLGLSTKAIEQVLAGRNFEGRVVGETPRLIDGPDRWGAVRAKERGEEIAAWLLDQHAADRPFAILDDGDDMGALRGHLVQTNWQRGIELHHLVPLVSLLQGRAP